MKLAISNIAWEQRDNQLVYSLMNKYGFTGLEVAPGKVVNNVENYQEIEINSFIEEITEYGIKPVSMQSLIYGRPDLKLFSNNDNLYEYLKKIIILGSRLGVELLVFGSPKNRIYEGMTRKKAIEKARLFFEKLGDFAISQGVYICIEANPEIYGGNFLCNTFETLDFVKLVNNKGIKLHLDLGTIIANNEDISKLKGVEKHIIHFHISEPYLEIIQHRIEHEKVKKLLKNYDGYFSVEMKSTSIENIEKTLTLISNIYD